MWGRSVREAARKFGTRDRRGREGHTHPYDRRRRHWPARLLLSFVLGYLEIMLGYFGFRLQAPAAAGPYWGLAGLSRELAADPCVEMPFGVVALNQG